MAIRKVEARLLQQLDLYVASVASKADVSAASIGMAEKFLEVQLLWPGRQTEIILVSLDTASRQSGPHLPQQTFTLFDRAPVAAGTLLVPASDGHIKMEIKHTRADIDDLGLGTYKHLSERELAKIVLAALLLAPVEELVAVSAGQFKVRLSELVVEPAVWEESWGLPECYDIYWHRGRVDDAVVPLHEEADDDGLPGFLPVVGNADDDLERFLEEIMMAAGEEIPDVSAGDETEEDSANK